MFLENWWNFKISLSSSAVSQAFRFQDPKILCFSAKTNKKIKNVLNHLKIYISHNLGENVRVDRKASTPSSSSSDVSKTQTFLDKKIKTFLAVITSNELLSICFWLLLEGKTSFVFSLLFCKRERKLSSIFNYPDMFVGTQ